MNPFSEIIDSSRGRPSILYSPSTINKLVDNLRSDSGDSYFGNETQSQSTPLPSYKPSKKNTGTSGTTTDNVAVEVHALLGRLKQLLGDVDVDPILEQLKLRNNAMNINQPLTLDEEHIPVDPVQPKPYKKPKLNARFALTSPQIMKEKSAQLPHEMSEDDDIPSGNSTGRTGEFSRYSLGSNRFSKRASELPSGILNYVSGNKLLRTTTRASLLSPDPYACLSPSKFVKASSMSSVPSYPENMTSIDSAPETENFQEFCTIGVQSDMLFGLKSLETTSLQPTEVSCVFPTDAGRVAIVSNLNEYCFPYGAELRYVTRKELDLLNAISNSDVNGNGTAFHNSTQSYGLNYQIMQFTDMAGVVYYATCVISSEPVEHVTPQLHANMDALQNSIAAANIIKRYLAFFAHKRKLRLNDELNARWANNMTKSRVQSVATNSGGTEDSSADSKGPKSANSKSIFKAFKRVIGVGASFMPSKGPSLRQRASGGGGGGGSDTEASVTKPSSKLATASASSTSSPAAQPKKPKDQGKVVSPVGSPILRQRSQSFCHRGSAPFSPGASNVFDEVHVDGSPSKSRNAAHRLDQSSRKVALITQKAYCIISNHPLHPLFFQILEAIALKERDRALMRWSCLSTHSGGTALAARDSAKDGMFRDMMVNQVSGSSAASVCAHTAKRNKFLSQLQTLDLSHINKVTEARRSVMSYNGKLIDIADKSYITTLKIMPRALTLKEWTTAILISLIPSELIVKIHSLLLQEQSLLVYGEEAGMVTAIATAFMQLLQPFTWEGIFVPLLPTAAYEALDAPVPYIIGIVAKSRPTATISSSAGVLSIDDFIRHPEFYVPSCFDEATLRHTLAAREDPSLQARRSRARHEVSEDAEVGLKYFECPCPEETTQGVAPLLDPMQCSQLKELHQLIAYHAVKIKVCLRSVQNNRVGKVLTSTTAIKAVLNDLNDEALRSLTTVLARVHFYNSSLCGEVLTQPGGWRQFGVLNSRSNQFEFLPDLFMAPLKANLRLQESVINTQLFVSFMDQQSENYLKLQSQRLFLSDWLFFRMHRKRKTHKRRTTRLHLY